MYRLCPTPLSHRTVACPAMMDRCDHCGCRGHLPWTFRCDHSNPATMMYLRDAYEEAADKHFYAAQRMIRWGLGWFPVEEDFDEEPPIPYDELVQLPVLSACQLTNPSRYRINA